MLYKDIDIDEAYRYWSTELGVPLNQFQNVFIKQSYKYSPHRHLRRSKYGTAHINVYDVGVYRKVIGWMDAIYEYNNLNF